jgi:hypothetical protein
MNKQFLNNKREKKKPQQRHLSSSDLKPTKYDRQRNDNRVIEGEL